MPTPRVPSEILAYYDRGEEAPRLFRGVGQLELARTQELVLRYLPDPPARVLDVGGGPGTYACWLAGLSYEVHLVDATPLHVEQARAASATQPDAPLASAEIGDARALAHKAASADAVLLLGPLYHLTARTDRVAALAEARRVVRPGGWLFAAAISRFASTLAGLWEGMLTEPDFAALAAQDRVDGQHRNPDGHPHYFTTAFFHHPDELAEETRAAGWENVQVLAIEGIGWLPQDFARRWEDPREREVILQVTRDLEDEPSLLGFSCHLLAVAHA